MRQLQDDFVMTIGDVASRFGVSTSRIRQRDDEFQPTRHSNGERRYSLARVNELLAKRNG
jgi:DNA-binding transcriptional MerR regulator